ncbi:ATP-binding protein [Bacteroides acidifaciens]|uniref:ATP-binding protein n=1 Tax=Bacteroides acidifaciens TaxID=85831 RepID=UPI00262893D5|nr:ATP-binding protein [Bacteroides acidifaciens]
MDRHSIRELVKWKEARRRKPLIIEGARQVGKTWLVKEFARKYYDNIAYINFEEQIYMRNLFETDFDVKRIIPAIDAATHQTCKPGNTLIFLDEIQEATNGITALKYFYENAPEYHIIAAGSLLGLELHKQTSFPVGKVQFMTLYPMSFLEFLDALGESALTGFIEKRDWDNVNLFAAKLKDLLKQYYYVGGMPEAVLAFSETRDWREVREIQHEILESYDRDFSKHAPEEIVPRIRQLWNSLPAQLSKENRKFLYGVVREGARAREYEIALQWLFDGGMIHRVSNVSAPRLPLKSYEDKTSFKIFAVDIGLLGAMCGLDSDTIVKGNSIFTEFKGALTEQYVLQQLKLKHEPYYWSKPNARQEIDFLIQIGSEIVPIEVKAEENLKAKSLRRFVLDNKTNTAYRTSMSNFREEEWMTNLPLYCLSII